MIDDANICNLLSQSAISHETTYVSIIPGMDTAAPDRTDNSNGN